MKITSKNNFRIHLRGIFISCTALLLCLSSCSDKKTETSDAVLQSPSEYEESTLPDEFVFPGESSASDSTVNSDDGASASSYAENTKSAATYLFGYTDISEYEEYISDDVDRYAIDYILKKDADASDIDLLSGITIGTEKLSVTFPVSVSELIGKGFTWLGDEDAKTVIPPGGDSILTLCTPETDEIIGFVTKNTGDSDMTAADATVTGIMLTSFNNFTAFGGITGTTELGRAVSLIGTPDTISVSTAEGEVSVMLSCTDRNGSSLTILGDGSTKEIIAVYVVSGNRQ